MAVVVACLIESDEIDFKKLMIRHLCHYRPVLLLQASWPSPKFLYMVMSRFELQERRDGCKFKTIFLVSVSSFTELFRFNLLDSVRLIEKTRGTFGMA